MIGRCPRCGGEIEMVPTTQGETVVVEVKDRDFAIVYGSGYAVRKRGRLVHECPATGKDGHVVR